jgi:vancomycin resistance protein YoaR
METEPPGVTGSTDQTPGDDDTEAVATTAEPASDESAPAAAGSEGKSDGPAPDAAGEGDDSASESVNAEDEPASAAEAAEAAEAAAAGEAENTDHGGTAGEAVADTEGEEGEGSGEAVAAAESHSVGVAHVKVPEQRSVGSAKVGGRPAVVEHSGAEQHSGAGKRGTAEQHDVGVAHVGGAEPHNVGVAHVGRGPAVAVAAGPVGAPRGTDVLPADTVRPYRKRPWVWILAFVAVVVVGGGIAVLALPKAEKSPAGTTVLGVGVGGLDEAALRGKVKSAVAPLLERGIAVTAATASFELVPAQAGVTLDSAATVTAAMNGTGAAVPPVLTVDDAALAAGLTAHKKAVVEPVTKLASPPAGLLDAKEDASFTASRKGVGTTAGANGWQVDRKKGVAAFVAAVRQGAASVTIPVTVVKPKNKPVDQLIGIFTTYHPCCAARVTNIHEMAKLVDGTVVKPGATFALDKFAGERTTAKGFVAAPAIDEGKLVQQVGGGVSQFSTTLYNAIWFAGLPSLTHQPHSKYIGRYPPGREATLDWQSIDNVFRNTTGTPIVIRTSYTGTSLTVALYGHTGDRKVVSTTAPYSPDAAGFSVSVTRKIYDADQLSGRTTTHWYYSGLD